MRNRPLSLIHQMWSPTRLRSLYVHVSSRPATSSASSIASVIEQLLKRPPPMLYTSPDRGASQNAWKAAIRSALWMLSRTCLPL